MTFFIIQHHNRGVFVGFDHSRTTAEWKPRFRWSIPLREGLNFATEAEAKKELGQIAAHVRNCCITAITR